MQIVLHSLGSLKVIEKTGTQASAMQKPTKQRDSNPKGKSFDAMSTAMMQAVAGTKRLKLPLIGHLPIAQQVRTMFIALGAFLLIAVLIVLLDAFFARNNAAHIQMAVDAQVQSQRLAKAVKGAVIGNVGSFAEVKEARDSLANSLATLSSGGSFKNETFSAAPSEVRATLSKINEDWKRSEQAATIILTQQEPLSNFGNFLKTINESNPQLLELTEQVSALKLQSGASPREISASGQLVMLTQRLAKNANELVSGETVNPETAFLLGKDTNTFRDLLEGLLNGSEMLRLSPAIEGGEVHKRLTELKKLFDQFQASVSGILGSLQRIVQAKQSENLVFKEADTLRMDLIKLEEELRSSARIRIVSFIFVGLFVLLGLMSAYIIGRLFIDDGRDRAIQAERQRQLAEGQEQELKKINDQNQAAILRLMNELQEVADGDLTVQATVSEDITGAIADSVNYTVEELRGLVSRINNTAEQVSDASAQARDTSMRLLAASEEQAREIKNTGDQVLQMADDIQAVSKRASESAEVARRSLNAAEQGQRVVQNSIAGMNEIRDQIQETSKRIKRLGESSQEIGEIIELISDITEQTNVLALNAAIQAASAGEAGRGFSVVAEEVQRLAERSGEATKQIAALIRTIQTDTQDAVAAMEKSTQGVVEGAKLSDAAGSALADIGQVSKELADLITNISVTTEQQAAQASGVSKSITKILTTTEQTSEGTRKTAGSIGQLSELALELKSSVARFKVQS
ncbi:MAG: type IV pili methyl-accepting chemotaxis transducer N-terminal domain-containing protein [Burkholderiaceae bacterium]|nr:type IV pili methyl-accepting chemotaxis transducer N-terminal domain-containing protein [Burkholderiaceae bacterium]